MRAGPSVPEGQDSFRRKHVTSVYVHAPFCARRCGYCDFAVQVRRVGDLEAWIAALEGELRAVEVEGRFPLGDALETLYVGGGTPSLLGAPAMDRLAGVLGRGRLGAPELEWTAEANPESFTAEVADGWRRAGVNRVSVGVQSFHEPTLRWMGRLHGPEGGVGVVDVARDAGFVEISVDLIFGLPDRLGRSWTADLERVIALEVPHVSLYGLTVEPGTPLGRAVAGGREAVATEERYREEFLVAARRLDQAGYVHYEVSNFALPGHASRHNEGYWSGTDYLGLGNSAHSYRHPLRRWNLSGWDAYSEVATDGRLPVAESELLEPDALRLERLWLALRTRRGLPRDTLGVRGMETVERWEREGLAESVGGVVRMSPEGWLVMDRLVVELDEAVDCDERDGAARRTR